jgi:hypothetical protein
VFVFGGFPFVGFPDSIRRIRFVADLRRLSAEGRLGPVAAEE